MASGSTRHSGREVKEPWNCYGSRSAQRLEGWATSEAMATTTPSSLAAATTALLAALFPCSCADQTGSRDSSCSGPPFAIASDAPSAPGSEFRDPDKMTGPPKAGGLFDGSTDVYAFEDGQAVTLSFECPMVDGPGPDFVVFENPFRIRGCKGAACTFTEVASVEVVSDDGASFSFPCPQACAGLTPVSATTASDALDPEVSGGDLFDLLALGDGAADALFVEIRLTDVPGDGRTFDLDAVGILNTSRP
jgi:hypothetical protein